MLQTPSPPKHLATTHEVVLRDGSTLHVRPLEAADEDALHDFFSALSPDSRAFRFLSLGVNLRAAARQAAEVDGRDRVGLVAVGPEGRIAAAEGLRIRVQERVRLVSLARSALKARGAGDDAVVRTRVVGIHFRNQQRHARVHAPRIGFIDVQRACSGDHW